MLSNVDIVIRKVESAFLGVSLDGGDLLSQAECEHVQMLDYVASVIDEDETQEWRKIPDRHIEVCTVALSFMNENSLRFHLPAYMCWSLRNYKESTSLSVDNTIYTCGKRKDLEFLDVHQKRSIIAFLKYMGHNGGHYVDSSYAKKVLVRAWSGVVN
jgi:hypothetical protein